MTNPRIICLMKPISSGPAPFSRTLKDVTAHDGGSGICQLRKNRKRKRGTAFAVPLFYLSMDFRKACVRALFG